MPKGQRTRAPVSITKRVIDALKVDADADYYVWDRELKGFGVRMRRSGRITFAILYRPQDAGRQTRLLTLGEYGRLTPEEARKQARTLLGKVAAGGDPLEQRKAARRAPTMRALGAEYLAAMERTRKATTAAEYRRMLQTYVFPRLGAMQVAKVQRPDVARFHGRMGETPYQANRVLALLSALFTYAETMGERPPHTNPAKGIARYPEESHSRYLTPDEFRRLGVAMRTAETTGLPPAPQHRKAPRSDATAKHRPKSADTPKPASPTAVNALRLLALSGLREQEALSLRWGQVDFIRGVLRFAWAQSKSGAKELPLGASAALLLDGLWSGARDEEGHPVVAGLTRPVFPGATPGVPLREIRRLWYAVRHAAGLEDVRLHDLRHSIGSLLGQSGESLLVIRDVLGHRRAATTEKYAHLGDSPAKRAADTVSGDVAALLQGTTTPVTPLRKAR